MHLTELFENWQKSLAEFNDLLKSQVKLYGQSKVLCQIKLTDEKRLNEKPISRSSYNARLLHPQYWPLPLLEQFASVLDCPELLTMFQNQCDIIKGLSSQINQYIKSGNVSNTFVIRLLGINQATFYAKQKDPRTWRKEELERIEEIIESIKKLNSTKVIRSK